ncbi:hypothetical protein BpHYR1_052815 [Brachionus plicatilis]|uniref:Uncharacterized protein n=1 Tax=Brachionus plicatilis TaxID=10195 RepID=A0A3M7P702_BRAPC|nr:hypothetical protein BpHYR1_052815 [Brachionus plicatilis]
MILDHDLISCCFDYCNLSEVKYENIYKLSCGHTSCAKISNITSKSIIIMIFQFYLKHRQQIN